MGRLANWLIGIPTDKQITRRRAKLDADQTPGHVCDPPMRWQFVDGNLDDLWRCTCGRLWRVDVRADGHAARVAWLPARWWQIR